MELVDTYQPAEENFVNQGTFLDQLENNLQYKLCVPEQQVYVHKVKVASAYDMSSKTSGEQEYSCNQNYGLQVFQNQTYSSDYQSRERVSVADSPNNRFGNLIPAGNIYRETVIFDGHTSPADSDVAGIIADNKVCYKDNSGKSSIIASNSIYGRSGIDTGQKKFKTVHTGVTDTHSFEEMQIKDEESRNLQTSVSSKSTGGIEEYGYKNTDALSSTQSYSSSVPTLDEGLQKGLLDRTNNDNSAVTYMYESNCPASSRNSDFDRSVRESDNLQDRTELTGVLSATVDHVQQKQMEYVSELKAADTAQDGISSAGDDSTSGISLSSVDSENSTEAPGDHSTLQETQTDTVLLEQKSLNKTDQRQKEDVQEETKQNTNINADQKKVFKDDNGLTLREISEQSQEIGSMSSTTDDKAEFVTVSWFHFKCKFCGKAFQKCKIWKMHLINEHGAKPYVCMYCDERFEQKVKLREHHRLHEVGLPKKMVEKPKEPKNKLVIKVSENSAIEEKIVADKKVATRGRKRKAITEPLKEQRNPDFVRKSSRKSAKVTNNIENSKQQSAFDDDAVGRNKRKRGPVFRYIPEANKPVRRQRQPVRKFPCEHCTRTFTSNHTKVLHEKTHKCYMCNSCGKMFKLKRLLKKHEITHNNRKKKTKPASKKMYCDENDDDDREETKSDQEEQADEDYVIEEVGEGEEEDSDKEGSEKDEGGPFKCQFCPRMIKKCRNLAKHEKTHENGIPHTCPHCQKVYVRRRDLRRHMVRHTTDKPHQCDKCKKRFKHGVGLRRHMQLHTGEGLLVCQFCGKKYNGKGSLKAHERIHTGEKPYSCPYCDKVFGTQTAQRYHELEHTGGMICHICGRQFKSKHNLQEHERIHSGERPYKCGRCDMSFMSVGARRYHMNVHTGEEHWCDKCNKQFTCKASLDAHKFTHTGLHPYKCKYCPKEFNSISGVRGHEKQVHLGLKRKHKTKSQKVLEKILIAQKKEEVNRALTKKEFKAISVAAKAATVAEQNGPLKPGRKPRDKKLPKDPDPSAFTSTKTTKLSPDLDYGAKAPVEDYNSPALVTHQKVAHMEKHHNKVLHKVPDVGYPTRVVIRDAEGHNSSSTVTQSVPVDYSATYASSALQKAISLMPRVHTNTPLPHATTTWPSQHIGNSHLDTMVESLVQFSKNY